MMPSAPTTTRPTSADRTASKPPRFVYNPRAMFTIINVSKAYGPKKLFENVNVSFSPGRRYGLTGPNGSGKTTFMKILAGDEEADSGTISRPKKFGILRQNHFQF